MNYQTHILKNGLRLIHQKTDRQVAYCAIIINTGTRDELKKVVWPTRQETIRLTLVVIIISLIVGIFLGGLDFVFVKIIGIIVK